MKQTKARQGFSLIELLIVVSIIGILSVALVPNLSGAPARARDAARKAALSEVAAAIETYNIDFGSYPSTIGNGCVATANTAAHMADIVTNYLKSIPPTFDNHGLTFDDGGDPPTPIPVDCPTSVQYTPISGGYILFVGLESGRGGDYDLITLQGYGASTTQATANTTVDPSGSGNAHAVIR